MQKNKQDAKLPRWRLAKAVWESAVVQLFSYSYRSSPKPDFRLLEEAIAASIPP